MKIKLSFIVDINPEAWQLNYGTPPKAIREDVKHYCELTIIEQLRQVGVLNDGS